MQHDETLLTVRETAVRLRRSEPTIRSWLGRRIIGHIKAGRGVLIPESEISRILERGYVPPAPQRGG